VEEQQQQQQQLNPDEQRERGSAQTTADIIPFRQEEGRGEEGERGREGERDTALFESFWCTVHWFSNGI